MRKFSQITESEEKKDKESFDFDKKDQSKSGMSSDIESLDDQLDGIVKNTEIDGEWEIVSIVDVSNKPPKIDEAIVINAELGDKKVKRGDFIYITALINKSGASSYHLNQMGVLKVRIVEIYNSLLVLNQLK
jgi:hypothetical protein